MKRYIIVLGVLMMSTVGFASAMDLDAAIDLVDSQLLSENVADEELSTAISFLYEKEITKFGTIQTFMPDQNIRRDEAAKMMVLAQKYVDEEVKDTGFSGGECAFIDLALAHSDLTGLILEACRANLFKGYQNKFMPIDPITNAQAVMVLVRMVNGWMEEPSDAHYASNYMDRAKEKGWLDGTIPHITTDESIWDKPAQRSFVAVLLYRALSSFSQ